MAIRGGRNGSAGMLPPGKGPVVRGIAPVRAWPILMDSRLARQTACDTRPVRIVADCATHQSPRGAAVRAAARCGNVAVRPRRGALPVEGGYARGISRVTSRCGPAPRCDGTQACVFPPAGGGARAVVPVSSGCANYKTAARRSGNMKQRRHPHIARPRRVATLAAALFALWAAPAAHAFEIDVGNPDIQLRWDNTIRYNLATRVQGQDQALLKNVNIDDGNRNFERGRWFNRFDVLTEADIIYKRSYGARVSAALWWDPAYRSLDSTSPQTSNTLVNGRPAVALSPFTQRYGEGPSGEFLDAFVFANFDAGSRPGQHQGRPAHGVLGRQPAARRCRARRVVCAELARRLEGPGDARRRGQGTVPAARRPDHPGPAAPGPVDRGAVVLQLAGGALSGKRHLPVDLRCAQLRRGLADPRRQSVRHGRARSSRRCCARSGAATTPSSRPTTAASTTSASRRAGARIGSTAPSASTIATPPTSSRRSC